MSRELSLEGKIEMLTTVRKNLIDDVDYNYICSEFTMLLDKRLIFVEITTLIPEFTLENAIKICIKHHITKPNGSYVWWYFVGLPYDVKVRKMREVRIKFLSAFISDLKKELLLKNQ